MIHTHVTRVLLISKTHESQMFLSYFISSWLASFYNQGNKSVKKEIDREAKKKKSIADPLNTISSVSSIRIPPVVTKFLNQTTNISWSSLYFIPSAQSKHLCIQHILKSSHLFHPFWYSGKNRNSVHPTTTMKHPTNSIWYIQVMYSVHSGARWSLYKRARQICAILVPGLNSRYGNLF